MLSLKNALIPGLILSLIASVSAQGTPNKQTSGSKQGLKTFEVEITLGGEKPQFFFRASDYGSMAIECSVNIAFTNDTKGYSVSPWPQSTYNPCYSPTWGFYFTDTTYTTATLHLMHTVTDRGNVTKRSSFVTIPNLSQWELSYPKPGYTQISAPLLDMSETLVEPAPQGWSGDPVPVRTLTSSYFSSGTPAPTGGKV